MVDDDPDILNILVLLLRGDGFRVAPATRPDEANAMLDSEPTQLVITDLRLGEDDGIEVIRHAALLTPHQPAIVMLTARQTSPESEEAQLLASVNGIMVQKPFDIDQVLNLARNLTGWRGRS